MALLTATAMKPLAYPVKMTRSALENAASMAAIIRSTESLTTDRPDSSPALALPAGEMGGC